MLAVHAVQIVGRHFGFLLGAEVVVHVHTPAQREIQSREEVGREGYVAVDTVADECVEFFVKHAVRVMSAERVVDQRTLNIVRVCCRHGAEIVVLAGVTALKILIMISPHGVDVIAPQQAVHGRRFVVTGHRHIVRLPTGEGRLHRKVEVLAELLVQCQRISLAVIPRVGQNPFVARVGKRETGAGTFPRRSLNRHGVGVGHASFENTRIPVVGIYPRQGCEFPRFPVL